MTLHIRRRFIPTCLALATAAVMAQPRGAGRAPAETIDRSTEEQTCTRCHANIVKNYTDNPHAQQRLKIGGKGIRCESCHKAKQGHIDSEGIKPVGPSFADAAQINGLCLSCHQGKHPSFNGSAHGKSNLSCISCHSIHSAGAPNHLLKVAEVELCYQCHAEVKSQFAMPSRHKVAEGVVECSDCHDPHDAVQADRPRPVNARDSFCSNCHTNATQPFVFQHAVMKTEGCAVCHFPHGGPNPTYQSDLTSTRSAASVIFPSRILRRELTFR